ncbi:MAG TPA: UDP-N-acetylmuramate dehydrogenase [Bryobacteraceae bacterium]|jgi:UDP-N-acetylmuramate dehydrogenase|nr:UDP-N-acetylmuramate dehydrogenase [Bryobacteraceae bacterium]
MPVQQATLQRLAQISNLTISEHTLLSRYTRFGIGGPAELYIETPSEPSFIAALNIVRASGVKFAVIGSGTNLIVSDAGFRGVILRFTASGISSDGRIVRAEAGAELQALVDYSIHHGLRGLETMTGIPGSVGAAIYGNAGAYGHSINESVRGVRFFDGSAIRVFSNAECEFHYRESVFKRHKDWIIFSTELELAPAPTDELRKTADGILKVRLEKYPVTMKCAGSIFKNLILAELPEAVQRQVPARVIREGKVPSAFFLEEVGAKGIQNGGIRVADYHANLIYNTGNGTARELCAIIADLKSRVQNRFGLTLEEEVQYIGFPDPSTDSLTVVVR